jgi:hypothetical protein
MADDDLKDAGGPEAGRPKREPPTIDLDASEVSGETRAAAEAKAEAASEARAEAASESEQAAVTPSKPISPWIIAPFSGAAAAALVIAVGWMLGWPPVPAPPAAPQVTAGAFDDLGKRVAGLETKTSKPATSVNDPAAAARIDALDKSLAALKSDIAGQRTQSDKLASAINDLKSAPRDSAGNVDLSAITGRIVELERKAQAQGAEIARESEKAADAKPADDMTLRRVVAAALLDVAVRHGDPYAATLKVAKSLSADPDKLNALDPFAEKGMPSPQQLNRELLTLVPKLSPSADTATTGTSIVDRLQAGAAKLVRVERTDTAGNDRGAIVARVTAAALRNDFGGARRDLAELSSADRAPAQAWLDKAAARDAALSASRQFADDAMASLTKVGQ